MNASFLSAAFIFSLFYRNLIMMCLGISLGLSYLRVAHLESIGVCLSQVCQTWEIFICYFFKYFSSTTRASPSGTPWYRWILHHRFPETVHFYSVFLSSDWMNAVDLSSNSWILSCHLCSTFRPHPVIFFLGYFSVIFSVL